MGARTHGGQDPPHWACAWADGSTGRVVEPHPMPGQPSMSGRGSTASASMDAGREGGKGTETDPEPLTGNKWHAPCQYPIGFDKYCRHLPPIYI